MLTSTISIDAYALLVSIRMHAVLQIPPDQRRYLGSIRENEQSEDVHLESLYRCIRAAGSFVTNSRSSRFVMGLLAFAT